MKSSLCPTYRLLIITIYSILCCVISIPHAVSAQPIYGESCYTKEQSLNKMIADSRVCEVNSDCVQVRYNMDGCNCPTYANKRKYVRSIEKKTHRYYRECVVPYQLVKPLCTCDAPVKHKCIWGKCVPVRCDFRITYPLGSCTCPVGGDARYNAIRHPDGTIEQTIYCEPQSFMLDFPDDKK